MRNTFWMYSATSKFDYLSLLSWLLNSDYTPITFSDDNQAFS